jgi:uncharacterized protein YndB with AHSA1/START domain
MRSTRSCRTIRARRPDVYQALLDPAAVARWRVPLGMTAVVHEFDPRENGRFRVTFTYDAVGTAGKSGGRIDTYHGRFVELVPDRSVVEVVEFETPDPELQGEMTVTTVLSDRGDGTDVIMVFERVPPGVALADNAAGTAIALDQLAALVEGDSSGGEGR